MDCTYVKQLVVPVLILYNIPDYIFFIFFIFVFLRKSATYTVSET